ncbi:MAG: hypothetical protein K2N60_10890 [Oscillospiraceae bacterium]|nr:hypothetical protein [Oscillospiraceae bacterium]
MTITELGNIANASALNSGRIADDSIAASRFKAEFNDIFAETISASEFAAEELALTEYPTLCGDHEAVISETGETEAAAEDEAEVEDEELITSCFECPENYKCEHYLNGGNDILADNGWAIKVNKRGFRLNKGISDETPQTMFAKPFDRTVIYDFSNIYLSTDFKKRRSD